LNDWLNFVAGNMENSKHNFGGARTLRALFGGGVSLVMGLAFLAPCGAQAQTPALRSVTLAWDPSPQAGVSGYIVYHGLASGSYAWSTNVGNQTTALIGDLVEGTTYYFAVTSYATNGLESDFSNEISFTPLAPPAPGTPALPAISALANRLLFANAAPLAIAFTIAEDQSKLSSLIVSVTVSDAVLFPAGSVQLSGSGTNRTLTLAPPEDRAGAAVVTVVASDSAATNRASFTVNLITVEQSGTVVERYAGRGAKVRVSSLLGASAPTVSLASVETVSAQGASVSWTSNWVYYTPPVDLLTNDTFAYAVMDAGGATATNTVTVRLRQDNAPSLNYTVQTNPVPQGLGEPTDRTYAVQFDGVPWRAYSIEYTDDLEVPIWQALGTGTADALGRQTQTDIVPVTILNRHYRAVAR
jgi:hypothetical protein